MDAKEFCAKYLVERRNTDCIKWDSLDEVYGNTELLPMWIADTEFRVPEAVQDELIRRVQHGAFGYKKTPDAYYEAFCSWEERHYGWRPQKEWVSFSPGVVSAMYWYVNAFTQPGDSVLLLTPVYGPFKRSIDQTGRRAVTCELCNNNGVYTVDFKAFEETIVREGVKLFINCSPHNPLGRVWTEDEMDQMFAICEKHDVLIASDEIHQDVIMPGNRHIPAPLVHDGKYVNRMVVSNAPSKTFNTCGLVLSHVIIPDEKLREQFQSYVQSIGHPGVSSLSLFATMAAFAHGDEWVSGMIATVWQNYCTIRDTLAQAAPQVVVTPLEGTYLAWLDFSAYFAPGETARFFAEKCGLAIETGEQFTDGQDHFVRINIGTAPKYIQQALDQIIANMPVLAQ